MDTMSNANLSPEGYSMSLSLLFMSFFAAVCWSLGLLSMAFSSPIFRGLPSLRPLNCTWRGNRLRCSQACYGEQEGLVPTRCLWLPCTCYTRVRVQCVVRARGGSRASHRVHTREAGPMDSEPPIGVLSSSCCRPPSTATCKLRYSQ